MFRKCESADPRFAHVATLGDQAIELRVSQSPASQCLGALDRDAFIELPRRLRGREARAQGLVRVRDLWRKAQGYMH